MVPALRGPAADDQMLRSQTMCHVAAVLRKSRPSAADQMHRYVTWLHARFTEIHTLLILGDRAHPRTTREAHVSLPIRGGIVAVFHL